MNVEEIWFFEDSKYLQFDKYAYDIGLGDFCYWN
jgi:hypothetical protein